MWRIDPFQVIAALILDAILGDPHGWPHIARVVGFLSNAYEKLLTYFFPRTVFLGLIFWLFVIGTMLAFYAAIYLLATRLGPWFSWLFQTFIIYQSIAARDLARHAKAVHVPLSKDDLPAARERLSMIVGRDTANLNASEISRGAIESVAESINDAIMAPVFWSILAGAPGALVYRTVNTLDSMVGHRTEKYERFGKVSARMDDMLNWLPARYSTLAFCLLNRSLTWSMLRNEASAHASPNAGWCESAMAHLLKVRLGGANYYDGQLVEGPVFNPTADVPRPADILTSINWMWRLTIVGSIGLLSIRFLIRNCIIL